MIPEGLVEEWKDHEDSLRRNNQDWVTAVVGSEGSGKSSVAVGMAEAIDPGFSVEEQVAFSAKEFRHKAADLEEFKPVVLDEGIEGLFSSEHMSSENKKTVKFLRKCRELNLFVFVNLPVFSELSKKIRNHRVDTVIRCVKRNPPGRAHVFGQSKVGRIEKVDGGASYPTPDMKFNFEDPEEELPETWDRYQELKIEDITDLGVSEDDEDEDEEARDWLSTGSVAERLDVSKKTVRNWCDDGRFKFSRLPNGDRRIPESEVEDLVA